MVRKNRIIVTNHEVILDCDMSLEEMVTAGKYDWGNLGINAKNFKFKKSKGKVRVTIKLICFNKFMSYREVLKWFSRHGLRPGNLPELLAFGAAYPEKQIEFPVVQVGTLWRIKRRRGSRGLYLRRGKKERGLSAVWLEHGFLSYYRFIAVHKNS